MDVQACFDTIKQDELLRMLKDIISEVLRRTRLDVGEKFQALFDKYLRFRHSCRAVVLALATLTDEILASLVMRLRHRP